MQEDQPNPMNLDRGSRPVPDPTLLTTQQLIREINSLKEVVFTRLDGMDTGIELFNGNITRVATDTDKQIQHLKEFHESRFNAMDEAVKLVRDALGNIHEVTNQKIAGLL